MIATLCPHCSRDINEQMQVCPHCGSSLVRRSLVCLGENEIIKSGGHSYVIDRILGQGGFGITYAGRNLSTNRVVAIKEYFPELCHPARYTDGSIYPEENRERYPKGLKSFIKEASMLTAVSSNPSIVHVLDYFEANNTAYMVMEYLNGITLQNVIENNGAMRFCDLLPKLQVLMKDIDALHKANVVHRDIAPDNIMLMPNGSLKLIDFGCARSMGDGDMTVMLKQKFAPVEQYNPDGQGPYTDVYALCATVYYCITGGEVPPVSTNRMMSDTIERPTELGADIGEANERNLMRGLAVMPPDRPQTMKELSAGFVEEKAHETAEEVPKATETAENEAPPAISGYADGKQLPVGKMIVGAILAAFMLMMVIAIIFSQMQ